MTYVRKRQPTHPGRILKEHYLIPLSLSITQIAAIVGVSRKALSQIVNERKSVTPQMALRLSRVFQTSPELWLNLQKNYDLWNAAHQSDDWMKIQPLDIPVDVMK